MYTTVIQATQTRVIGVQLLYQTRVPSIHSHEHRLIIAFYYSSEWTFSFSFRALVSPGVSDFCFFGAS
jgi:hypothetical protein